jgi:NAD+ synthase
MCFSNFDPEKTLAFLVAFLEKSMAEAGFDRAVIGLSGGVDSSLACTLAVKALGPEHVLGLSMPYRSSHPLSSVHAARVANGLGIELIEVDITPQIDLYFEKHSDADVVRRGNKMARERMSILFDFSAARRGLVVGTSNRTEILLGYGTLFGDTACSLNPLGGLYKTLVFSLARFVCVPEEITSKAPSADLWEEQTDEDELGFTYEKVDRLLFYLLDKGQKENELMRSGFELDFIRKVSSLIDRFAFKSKSPRVAHIPCEVLGL